jgi:cytoskeletal protein RodZ
MSTFVGKELRKQREEKKLTLTQVSNDLFIRTTYLQAIENGRTEILPSAVQGRGFVRMYSDYLGLNSELILQAWDRPDEPFPPETNEKPAKIEHTQPQKTNLPETDSTGLNSKTGIGSEPVLTDDPVEVIFHEIGRELRNRRESLNLTYQDAEIHTLVREYYLKKIEDGEFEELPSTVQARGMLNNYASFLNLDVEKIMLQYADAIQLRSERKGKNVYGTNEKKSHSKQKPVKKVGRLKQFLTPDLFVGLTVMLGMAAIIIYSAVTISEFKGRAVGNTPDVSGEFLKQLSLVDNNLTLSPEPSSTPVAETNVAENGVDTTAVPGEADTILSGAIQVYIEANQRTFLRVLTDGKEVFTGRTIPGNTYPFDASEMIEITTGNAAAISVTYNQQRLGVLGDLGESLTLQFTGSLPVTPTPLNSLTPTSTYEPTYTPQPERQIPTVTITPYIP